MRALSRRLTLVLVVYFFAGTISQKLLPGVDEITPFFGWSLFSKVPNEDSQYAILIHRHDGQSIEPPSSFLRAVDGMVVGNRYIARKLIQRLGQAYDGGAVAEVESLRALLEQNYLAGRVRYELVYERYEPLEKWRRGTSLEQRSLAFFERVAP